MVNYVFLLIKLLWGVLNSRLDTKTARRDEFALAIIVLAPTYVSIIYQIC